MAAAGLPAAAIEAQLGQQKAALAAGQESSTPAPRSSRPATPSSPSVSASWTPPEECASSPRTARPRSPRSSSRPPSTASSPEVRQQVQDIAQEVSSAGVTALASKEITEDVSELFGISEILGIAIAALVLIVMLGTLIAAGLPLLMAVVGVAVGVGATFALSGARGHELHFPDAGADARPRRGHRLFPVHRQPPPRPAAGRHGRRGIRGPATGTSGNAVLFAGLTVIIALAALVIPGLALPGRDGPVRRRNGGRRRRRRPDPDPGRALPGGPKADLQAGLGQSGKTQHRARPRGCRTGPGTNTAAATAGAAWSPSTR